MPRIDTYTAQTGPGIMRTDQVSPESFGRSGFQSLTGFGEKLEQAGEKIQHQKDQLDVARIAADYEMGLDDIKNRVVLNPDLSTHGEQLAKQTQQLQESILKDNPDLSSAAIKTFQSHALGEYARARIEVAHEGQKIRVQRAVVDFTTTQDRLIQTAATSSDPAVAAQKLVLANELRTNMERSGFLSPADAQKSKDAAQDKYWSTYAQHDPQGMLRLAQGQAEAQQAGEGGTAIAGMDPEKLHTYVGLAVATIHGQQVMSDMAQKAEDDQIKRTKALNADLLTADLLQGQSVTGRLPAMLRARGIDDTVARTLAETETRMNAAPDPTKYQKGLAANTEMMLEQQKYDNKPLDPQLGATITDDFNQGRTTKEEFTHLMGVLRGVDDYKHQQGKEKGNEDIAHAHTNLVQRLRTTGPADKFDALSEQTIAEAGQFFYRRMAQQPNGDPWKVMKEAEDIFRPAIEKRLGLSKGDKAVLDDAKMQGLTHTKAISPASLKAYRDKTQEQEGWNIVQEALKNLPPPPPPGYFERLKELVAPSQPRKAPGVMGGE